MKIIFFFNDNEKDRGIDLNKEITWFVFSEKNKNTFVFNVEISSKGEEMYVREDSKEFIVVTEVTDVMKMLKITEPPGLENWNARLSLKRALCTQLRI